MAIKGIKDLKVWSEARELNKSIFSLILSDNLIKDFPLKDQINRSAGSIMDNIAEGYERQGNKEFRQFLGIARGSCGEVKSQLYRLHDRQYIDDTNFKILLSKSENISKMINGLIKYINSSDYSGSKFKEATEYYN